MENTPLVMERTYNAPVSKVWNALTNENQMRQWYFNISGFKPEVGYEFTFTGQNEDMTYLHLCKVTEIVPETKLAYTWRYEGYEGNSLLTFELFAEGEQTRVKLTHAGLETFPQTKDFKRENFVMGWTHILGISLKEFVEK